jgi:hypothetical protein
MSEKNNANATNINIKSITYVMRKKLARKIQFQVGKKREITGKFLPRQNDFLAVYCLLPSDR